MKKTNREFVCFFAHIFRKESNLGGVLGGCEQSGDDKYLVLLTAAY